MSDDHSLKLVVSRPAPRTAETAHPPGRYRVTIVENAVRAPGISVSDRHSGRLILSWRGRVAERILDMDALGLRCRGDSGFDCDKPLLQRLAIAGAAAERQLADSPDVPLPNHRHDESLEDRRLPERSSDRWSSLHGAVQYLLEAFPGQHLAEDDVVCLMQFRLPCLSRQQVRSALSDLADWNKVQTIRVPTGAIHYDLDTRPHLHVFDARTQQLYDAPESGVLQVREA